MSRTFKEFMDAALPAAISAYEDAEKARRDVKSYQEEFADLRQWKEAALPMLLKYDKIALLVGGEVGSSKVENLERLVKLVLAVRDAHHINK